MRLRLLCSRGAAGLVLNPPPRCEGARAARAWPQGRESGPETCAGTQPAEPSKGTLGGILWGWYLEI